MREERSERSRGKKRGGMVHRGFGPKAGRKKREDRRERREERREKREERITCGEKRA